jgi:hypothetical protein
MKSVSSPTLLERRWVLFFAIVVMLITGLPYLIGYTSQAELMRFTGFVFGVEDGNSYIAKMLSGSVGAWYFRTPYTGYPQNGVLMFLPYLLLGKLAAPDGLHEQLVSLYQLFRLVSGILMMLATYDFLSLFLVNIHMRRLGLALATLGGGLGWLLILLGQGNWLGWLPLDLYSPETFGFLSIYGLPHMALGRALMLWVLVNYLNLALGNTPEHRQRRSIVETSVLWFLAGLAQPLAALLTGGVMAIHLGCTGVWQLTRPWRGLPRDWQPWRRALRLFVLSGLLPGLLVLYNVFITIYDPYMRQWTQQNIIRSPHPLHYLAAYGLLLPFVLAGSWSLLRKTPWAAWLPVGWVFALPLLAYAPVDLQRRLPEGLWVAWVALALVAIEAWLAHPFIRPVWQKIIMTLPVLLCFLTTVFLLLGGIQAGNTPGEPIFRPRAEVLLFESLAAEAEPGAIVLSSYQTGNAMPAWAPVRTVLGHGPESIHLAALMPQVEAFYNLGTSDAARLELIRQFDIRYIWWGPHERELGSWDPSAVPYLQLVEKQGAYMLFKTVEAAR